MTKDYTAVSDHELNLELAEKTFPNAHIVVDENQDIFMDEPPFDYTEWDPCDPDSNQIERYVFPKLRSREAYAHIYWTLCGVSFDGAVDVHVYWNDKDNINRTKAIAARKAFDELEVLKDE